MRPEIKIVIKVLQERLATQKAILNAVEYVNAIKVFSNTKRLREIEANKIKAVIQEQKELILLLLGI